MDATNSGGSFATLTVQQGRLAGQQFRITQSSTTIGRSPDNDLTINHPEVSRHHARLTWNGRQFSIEDLGSTNGTFVNNVRIGKSQAIPSGASLGLGALKPDIPERSLLRPIRRHHEHQHENTAAAGPRAHLHAAPSARSRQARDGRRSVAAYPGHRRRRAVRADRGRPGDILFVQARGSNAYGGDRVSAHRQPGHRRRADNDYRHGRRPGWRNACRPRGERPPSGQRRSPQPAGRDDLPRGIPVGPRRARFPLRSKSALTTGMGRAANPPRWWSGPCRARARHPPRLPSSSWRRPPHRPLRALADVLQTRPSSLM